MSAQLRGGAAGGSGPKLGAAASWSARTVELKQIESKREPEASNMIALKQEDACPAVLAQDWIHLVGQLGIFGRRSLASAPWPSGP